MDIKQDKRLFPRVRFKEPLHYRVRGSPNSHSSVTEDISLGGMCFNNSLFMPPSTQLNLEIPLLSRILRPIGKVVWSSPFAHSDRYRLGIEFVEFDPHEKKFLSDFITMKQHKL